ncbi:HK97 gp10 family phage protein [Sphingomonas sp. ABOLF]|nr:HK97 gp10 family phage protein [Sphingomonas sp. ABOLF]
MSGGKAHAARLKRLTSPEAMAAVDRALFNGGERLQSAAQASIMEGAVSGKGHVPSRPGEPPSNDTQRLHDNIETVRVEPWKVQVSSNAPYSKALEFGTSKMAERPFMRPAAAKTRKEVADLIVRAVKHISKGGTVS